MPSQIVSEDYVCSKHFVLSARHGVMESLQRNFCRQMKQPTVLDLTAAASQTVSK